MACANAHQSQLFFLAVPCQKARMALSLVSPTLIIANAKKAHFYRGKSR